MDSEEVQEALREIADPAIAKHSQHFFKTNPGEYGEGDQFLGIRVPETRKVAKQFSKLSLKETKKLLQSLYHEERLCALIILVNKMKKADSETGQQIYQFYLDNIDQVNNWDLVDTSAEHIIGHYLEDKDRNILYELAESKNLWKRRIAIMTTFYFIKNNNFADTLGVSQLLLNDDHDLIHKAVGWMLREVGKRNIKAEEKFLNQHGKKMPRTMLRYAIEKFTKAKRKYYLYKTKPDR